MNFSQPGNAREVNKIKVLNALRGNNGLSRAQLSSLLGINKVSMGEIVDILVSEGLVAETGRQITAKGRPGTSLSINLQHSTVIGIDIGSRVVTATLFSLDAKSLRMERFPSSGFTSLDDYTQTLHDCMEKLSSMATSPVIGACIAVNAAIGPEGRIGECYIDVLKDDEGAFIHSFDDMPFPVCMADALRCAAEAERFHFSSSLEDMLFINWGEHLSAALIQRDRIIPSLGFGHMPVRDRGLCHCGSTGCLETVSSGYGLRQLSLEAYGQALSGRDLARGGDKFKGLLMQSCQALAKALVFAVCATGASAVLIGGGLSNLDDEYFAYMLDVFSKSAPSPLKGVPVFRSYYREKGTVHGAGLEALDRFFYKRGLLIRLECL